MTDKELLELAAKAHGGLVYVEGMDWIHENAAGERGAWWNPIADDGDAFRLATELSLNVFHTNGTAYALPSDDDGDIEQSASYVDYVDKYAATRRAIVRAAAEIWRTK